MAKILLIDDDHAVRTMMRLTLAHFGHTVTEARDGREGLKLFDQTNADLVITDIVMPEADGLEVLMAVTKRRPDLRIIAISGGGRQNAGDHLRVAKLLGATKVLAKPFSTEALMVAVNETLADGSGGGATTLDG
jgi:CheY-like chemotaxis protein